MAGGKKRGRNSSNKSDSSNSSSQTVSPTNPPKKSRDLDPTEMAAKTQTEMEKILEKLDCMATKDDHTQLFPP